MKNLNKLLTRIQLHLQVEFSNYTTIPKSICQLQTGNGKPTDIYV